MKIITESQCTGYSKPNYLETPERVSRTVDHLRAQKDLDLAWAGPVDVEDSVVLRAHDPSLLERLEESADFDADTPHFPGISKLARRSAGGAIAALDSTCSGNPGFSLMRPPGHHASRFMAMGYCYLNSIAIAALDAQRRGFKSVAVFDFDVHHGNGTEDILLDLPGFAFASVHLTGYPFTGKAHRGANCFNYPMPAGTPREDYRAALVRALDDLIKFKPGMLAVSAGFDAFRADPLSDQRLEAEDYHWLGQRIRAFQIPVFGILEGGYSAMLPELVAAYLRGLEGKPFKTTTQTQPPIAL
jgi:acetoin utilization deacetylase AcuC-like enzyme